MVTPAPGATTRIEITRVETDVTDGLGKKLNFKEDKDNEGNFSAKGKDGNIYSYSTKNVIVEVSAVAAIDTKELRKRNPGVPLPKDEAKRLDEEIKKEKEEQEKAGETPEERSFRERAVAPEVRAAEKRGDNDTTIAGTFTGKPQGQSKGR